MVVINLKNILKTKPRILKGNRSSQMKGNSNNMIRASGQQRTKRMSQRIIAINVTGVEISLIK